MTDYTDLQKAAEYAAQDTIKFADESEEILALQQFHEEVDPETVLSLIAEIEALKGPHDWLAEDLIKELVDNAQSFQENACEEGEDPFVVVLLAAASRIRRQEANIDQLKAGFKNFHRSLCERFGYFHDEIDWQCDQVSLEEHIDTQLSHVSAENTALRAQVELLQRGAGQLQEENEALRNTALSKAVVWCACGDGHPANSYGAGFMDANGGVCANCDAAVGSGHPDSRGSDQVQIPTETPVPERSACRSEKP
ncbi:hypothetical protein PSH90_12195 [Pseudomonas sp. FP1762]|uniref:hypothetical protein n=1 Tax=Pseudomonas sp. FP1762 TaxID=2954080 RepID=UPI0027344F9B|nr:hypothetical protein [Pseudomonas sp. FP1762]WLG64826.1 hypothetical protein PSH90_12195 [Pseudomonas sp. FP1762]